MKTLLTAVFATAAAVAMSAFAAEPESAPMMQMHEHMQKMQETMGAIKAEQDPARRSELMTAHMQEMREGMRMMNGDAKPAMSMEKRMEAMEAHMEMMQLMMGHMMEHDQEAAPSAAPEHQH